MLKKWTPLRLLALNNLLIPLLLTPLSLHAEETSHRHPLW